MNAISQDAQRLKLLFEYGVVNAKEVVAWADSWIEQLDSPPDLLLELSMMASGKTVDILSLLRRLSEGAEFWTSFRCAVPHIREYVAAHPDRAESVANHMYVTFRSFSVTSVPDDLRFIYSFEDAFSLASQGTYGSLETVCQEFVQAMDDCIARQPRR